RGSVVAPIPRNSIAARPVPVASPQNTALANTRHPASAHAPATPRPRAAPAGSPTNSSRLPAASSACQAARTRCTLPASPATVPHPLRATACDALPNGRIRQIRAAPPARAGHCVNRPLPWHGVAGRAAAWAPPPSPPATPESWPSKNSAAAPCPRDHRVVSAPAAAHLGISARYTDRFRLLERVPHAPLPADLAAPPVAA